MSEPEPVVFVVDDADGVRNWLASLLESVGRKVRAFSTAEEFLAQYDPATPGCLILDVRMPGMSGLELQEELNARGISIPVIIMTGYPEVQTAVQALESGAVKFIEKPVKSDQLLLDSVRQALERDRQQRAARSQRDIAESRWRRLTDREKEIMALMLRGLSSKQIAEELRLSIKTVEFHRANIMRKMEVNSIVELVQLSMHLPIETRAVSPPRSG